MRWVAALLLAGCTERYLISERALERTIDLDRWENSRAAFPAIRQEDNARVWVRM
jgi:hypothetical protein